MNRYIDLHVHSHWSEGALSCRELLDYAQRCSFSVIALTDHNVIDGVPELEQLAKPYRIKTLPGVELYVQHHGRDLHLLGYGFRPGQTPLAAQLRKLQALHHQDITRTLSTLERRGYLVNEKRLFSGPSRYLGAVHLLKEIESFPANRRKIERALTTAQRNYFQKVYFFFGKTGLAPLPQPSLPAEKAIGIIKQSGGLAILAHPGQQLTFEQDSIIYELILAGLDGLEVLSPYHNWHQIEHYQKMTIEKKLLLTGGSDYHTDIDYMKHVLVKRQWDYFKVPYAVYKELLPHLKIAYERI